MATCCLTVIIKLLTIHDVKGLEKWKKKKIESCFKVFARLNFKSTNSTLVVKKPPKHNFNFILCRACRLLNVDQHADLCPRMDRVGISEAKHQSFEATRGHPGKLKPRWQSHVKTYYYRSSGMSNWRATCGPIACQMRPAGIFSVPYMIKTLQKYKEIRVNLCNK